MIEDTDEGHTDAIKLRGREEIIQREVLHEGTVVGYRGEGMLQTCSKIQERV